MKTDEIVKTCKKPLSNFRRRLKALHKAEHELNSALGKTDWTKLSILELQDLIDRMPQGWKGMRKMYEHLIRMDMEAEKGPSKHAKEKHT